MNPFYNQPKILQWIEAILLLILGFLPALVIIDWGYSQHIYYFLFIIYVPISQFSATPFFKLTGVYTYYSPMLLGYMANDKQIDLHSGGSFDYLFVLRKNKPGIDIRNQILIYHLEGLLNIISAIENRTIKETVNIIGTSYFFKERTLAKMGFKLENPTLAYRINLFINFIDLTWMYSLSKGTFAIPKLWEAKKACITGKELVDHKQAIESLYSRMKQKAIS